MELPILQYLALPEGVRRIVLRFLRKPHPTALLINELEFDEDIWEWSRFKGVTLTIAGPSIRVCEDNLPDWDPHVVSINRPTLHAFVDYDSAWGIHCHYDPLDGECERTRKMEARRIAYMRHLIRYQLGIGRAIFVWPPLDLSMMTPALARMAEERLTRLEAEMVARL